MTKKKAPSVSMNARVSANLVAFRTKLGLTQDDVIARSKKAGLKIGKRTYSEWETGVRVPTARSFEKLEQALGCSMKDLVQ